MKNLFLLDGKQLPFKDAGQPEVFFKGDWYELIDDQKGEFYFMYDGKAFSVQIGMNTDPDFSDLLDSFALCISLLAGSKMSEAIVNTPFGEKSVGSFIGNCEDLHDKFKHKQQPTYVVASTHGENLSDPECTDIFSAFRGEDGFAYSEALKEYKGLLKVDGCKLAVLARVIESTDY